MIQFKASLIYTRVTKLSYFLFAFQLPVELILSDMQFTTQIEGSLQLERKLPSAVNQGLEQNKMEICPVKMMETGTRAFPNVLVCNMFYTMPYKIQPIRIQESPCILMVLHPTFPSSATRMSH